MARQLRERNITAVRVLEHHGEGTSLMEVWKDEQAVIVIDTIFSHSEPGSIHRFDATRQPPQKRIFQSSTHGFGLHEAVQLAPSLHRLPPRLIIYGIEGKSFVIGKHMSAEVEIAAPRLVDRILEEAEPFL